MYIYQDRYILTPRGSRDCVTVTPKAKIVQNTENLLEFDRVNEVILPPAECVRLCSDHKPKPLPAKPDQMAAGGRRRALP